jgi:hypothetical protein
MEYVTPRSLTDGSTAGNGVLCGSAPIVTTCNNRGNVGSDVFCWIRPKAISRGPTGQASQFREVESNTSAFSNWETDPSEVVIGGGVESEGAPIVVSRRVETPS